MRIIHLAPWVFWFVNGRLLVMGMSRIVARSVHGNFAYRQECATAENRIRWPEAFPLRGVKTVMTCKSSAPEVWYGNVTRIDIGSIRKNRELYDRLAVCTVQSECTGCQNATQGIVARGRVESRHVPVPSYCSPACE